MTRWICIFFLLPLMPRAQAAELETDLKAFMEKVLERREINWEELQDFVFKEEESLELRGFELADTENFRKQYDWYYRDGKLVRRLVRADGVDVSGPEKVWSGEKRDKDTPLSRESFFGFHFKPDGFLVQGDEEEDGHRLMVVEYYPRDFFDDDEEKAEGDRDEDDEVEREVEEALEKTSLVRLWILPEEHQIKKMTFENVGLEFLPYRWLVRIDGIHASLIMNQPIGDVWLPAVLEAQGSVSTAAGKFSIRYQRRFWDYREADVKVRFRFGTESGQNEKPQTP